MLSLEKLQRFTSLDGSTPYIGPFWKTGKKNATDEKKLRRAIKNVTPVTYTIQQIH